MEESLEVASIPRVLRASKLPLLLKCPGSSYLPTDDTVSENTKKANDWGHMVHYWKETGEIRGPDKRTERAFLKSIEFSGIDRLSLWPDGGRHEQAVSVRADGVERCVIARHPGVGESPDSWITGTDDFHYWLFEGELWVDDLKTGKFYADQETGENLYPQDVGSAQLKFYALAIAEILGYRGTVHVSLTHWPRLPLEHRHRPPARFWTSYSYSELVEFWGELEKLYQRHTAGKAGDYRLTPGSHCRFCPSKAYCLEAEPTPQPNYRKYTHV